MVATIFLKKKTSSSGHSKKRVGVSRQNGKMMKEEQQQEGEERCRHNDERERESKMHSVSALRQWLESNCQCGCYSWLPDSVVAAQLKSVKENEYLGCF